MQLTTVVIFRLKPSYCFLILFSAVAEINNRNTPLLSKIFDVLSIDNQIDWYSFRKEMEKSGMEEDDIKSYFQKYDENGNLQLNRKECAKLEESLTKLKNKV